MNTAEEAEAIVKELDGTLFNDRKLRVRYHTPYNPHPRLLRLGGSLKRVSRYTNQEDGDEPAASSAPVGEGAPEVGDSKPFVGGKGKGIRYSETTLFIKGLGNKITEERIKEFFGEFRPTNVKILRPRSFIGGFKYRPHNALVSFTPLEWLLDHIIESCKNRVLDGYSLAIGKSFASRGEVGVEAVGELKAAVEQSEDAAVPVKLKESVKEETPVEPEAASGAEVPNE